MIRLTFKEVQEECLRNMVGTMENAEDEAYVYGVLDTLVDCGVFDEEDFRIWDNEIGKKHLLILKGGK